MSDKNTEIAVNEGFAVLANQNVLNEALADDCQGLEFSFDRVKLPVGGGTAFEIPSAEGEDSEMAKDITGVIVYNHPAYAYYHDKYTGGNNPPDCGSFDGVNGIGNPGGNCQNCPYMILSILVDTFSSRVLNPMLLPSGKRNIVVF